MDYEILFRNVGMLLCLSASIYMLVSGSKKIGLIFLIGFLLQLQGMLYYNFFDSPESMGKCWATKQSYYDCLPLSLKLSTHLSQLGIYIMALAVFLSAKHQQKNKRKLNRTPIFKITK